METEKSVGPTPAPWIVDEVTTPNGKSYFINHLWDESVEGDDGSTFTDETHTDEIAEVVMDYKGDRALCNARLLAAAPDLLDACKTALTYFERHASSLVPVPAITSIQMLETLRDAITKAQIGLRV